MNVFSFYVANEEPVLSQVKECGIPHTFGELDGGQEIIMPTARDFNAMWTHLFLVFNHTAFHRGVVPDPLVEELNLPESDAGY